MEIDKEILKETFGYKVEQLGKDRFLDKKVDDIAKTFTDRYRVIICKNVDDISSMTMICADLIVDENMKIHKSRFSQDKFINKEDLLNIINQDISIKVGELQKKIKDFEKSLKEQVNEFQSEIGLQASINIWESCLSEQISDKFVTLSVSVKVQL